MKTNSQILLSPRLYLGDIDGDSLNELIEVDGPCIHIFKCEYDHKPLFTHIFPHPVKRLIIGDFVNKGRECGKDQIFAILEDETIRGYAISDDKTNMWWWFTQENFIKENEHFIVGDFDGDSADEIMVYNPKTGSIKLYEKKENDSINKVNGYSLGDIRAHDLKNKLIIAGEFGQSMNRDDILVIDKSIGQIKRFDTVTNSSGEKTFWWRFTSNANHFSSNDEIIVANIDGGYKDGVIVRKSGSGDYVSYKMEFNDGDLEVISKVSKGQLPIKPNQGRILASKVRNKEFRSEKGGERRDDILYFNSGNLEFIRTDARFDKTKNLLTYWRSYTSFLLMEPQAPKKKMACAVILCNFKGQQNDNNIEQMFREMFRPDHNEGIIKYWHDISLGRIDVSESKVYGWVELDLERKDAGGMNRRDLVEAAIIACENNNIDVVSGFHCQMAVFQNNWSVDRHPKTGEEPPGNTYPENQIEWEPYWIDGSTSGRRISAPPHGHTHSFVAHEMAHTFGFNHDLGPDLVSGYGDPTCIMGTGSETFNHPQFRDTGPAMSFPQLYVKGFMYERRIKKYSNTWGTNSRSISFDLAPLNDRRLNAYLGVILPVDSSNSWEYFLEYMRPTEWNKGLEKPRLVIRRIVGNTAAYLGRIKLPSGLNAEKEWIEPKGNVRFIIKKIRNDERMINVRVVKER